MSYLEDTYETFVMRKKNILIITGDLHRQGGVANFVAILLRSFSEAMDVAFFRIGSSESGSVKLPRILYPLIDSVRLVIALIRQRYTLVHINPSLDWKSIIRDGLFMLVLAMMKTPVKLVFFHGWDIDVENQITKYHIFQVFFKWTFGRANKIIILSNKFRKPLIFWGIDDERIELYSTTFDSSIFLGRRASIKQYNNDLSLIFLSRFVKEKGIYETLEAFEIVYRQIPNAKLVMAGDGPERKMMEEWVIAHGLKDNVSFPGYLRGKQKIEAMIHAELFVFPTSYDEGCPISILEAMAVGLPIITTDVGGIPDIFIDGENGRMLVAPPQVMDIADVILEFVRDRKMMTSIADNNHRIAWSKYESAIVTARLEKLYNELLNKDCNAF